MLLFSFCLYKMLQSQHLDTICPTGYGPMSSAYRA